MKIGITCYPTYGGSGAVATELGIALAAKGHEVHFITYQQPFRLPSFLPRIYFHEVDVGRYPLFEYPPYDLALAVRMHEVVKSHELDLLHVHYAIPHATSAWIAREMLREAGSDVKVITTLHGTDITIVGQDRSFHPITKFSIEKSDRITAVSQYLRQRTFNAFGCAGCQVEAGFTCSGSERVSKVPDSVSVNLNVSGKSPETVGLPETTPVAWSSDSPAGSVPDMIDQVPALPVRTSCVE